MKTVAQLQQECRDRHAALDAEEFTLSREQAEKIAASRYISFALEAAWMRWKLDVERRRVGALIVPDYVAASVAREWDTKGRQWTKAMNEVLVKALTIGS